MDKKPSVFNLTLAGLEAWAAARKEPGYRAKQVLHWLYQKRISRFREMSDLSERLRDELDGAFRLEPLTCARQTGSRDTTQKFLFALSDPARLAIVRQIAVPGVVSICQSVGSDMPKSTRSHHLKVLHEAGVLERSRRGVWVCYRVRPEAMGALSRVFEAPPDGAW